MAKRVARAPKRAQGGAVSSSIGQTEETGPLRHDQPQTIPSWYVTLWLAPILLLCFVYFAPHADANESARFDLTVALVNHATVQIDRYVSNTIDDDLFEGHYYITKAPGQAFLGVPAYLAYQGWSYVRGNGTRDHTYDAAAKTFVVALTIAVPATIFLLIFFWFLGYFSTSLSNRAILTLALGLGTPFFPYAQNFYAHVPVACLLFGAFGLVHVLRHGVVSGQVTRRLVAHPRAAGLIVGLALGLVILEEFPAALLSLVIGLYALVQLPRRLWPYLIAGGVPPVLLLLAYNLAVYHSPFVVAYTSGASVQFRHQLEQGVSGFTWPPKPAAIYGMSFSPFRGIFFLSPFLLMAIPGYALWARRGEREWLLFLVIPVLYFFTIAMYAVWWGGYSVGPRHLIPTLPFLAFPAIFTLDRLRAVMSRLVVYGLVGVLLTCSLLAVWAETIAWPPEAPAITIWPSDQVQNPLFTQYLPALLHGQLVANVGNSHLGLDGPLSLLPLFMAIGLWSATLAWLSPSARWGTRQG